MAAQPLCHDAVRLRPVNMQTRSHLQVLPAPDLLFMFILCLTVWGVEPVVTHQTSWLESTFCLFSMLFLARSSESG